MSACLTARPCPLHACSIGDQRRLAATPPPVGPSTFSLGWKIPKDYQIDDSVHSIIHPLSGHSEFSKCRKDELVDLITAGLCGDSGQICRK